MEEYDILIVRPDGSEVKKFSQVIEEFGMSKIELKEMIEQGIPCQDCYFDIVEEGKNE